MIEEAIKNFEQNLIETTTSLKDEFLSLRGSRPNVKLVEDIRVEAYGQSMAVKQLGSISLPPPREIMVTVWDRGLAAATAKAIGEALNVMPGIDGGSIRGTIPVLTDERRKDLIKMVSKISEEARIKIRSIRDGANKKIKETEEEGGVSEDESFRLKERVQKSVDKANKEVEELLKNKISEVENG